MNELKMRCMKSDASNSPLRRFRWIVLSVADHGVADRRKLHADLILQSGHERDSDERCASKGAFDGIAKLGTRRFGVASGGHLLKHSYLSKVVNERPFSDAKMPANYREILPHRSVAEKLPNERFAIRPGFCKEQDPGRIAIDAMYDIGPLSLGSQFCTKKRQGGWGTGVIRRHCQQFRRFVEGHDGIVFVEHDQLPRDTTIAPVLLS